MYVINMWHHYSSETVYAFKCNEIATENQGVDHIIRNYSYLGLLTEENCLTSLNLKFILAAAEYKDFPW